MKCLVTGSHGCIGQHLVKALEKRGDEVVIMDHETLSQSCVHIPFDIDYIFHLAAYGNMANINDKDSFVIWQHI